MSTVVLSLDLETTGLSRDSQVTQIGVALELWEYEKVQQQQDDGYEVKEDKNDSIIRRTRLKPFASYVRCLQTEEFDAKVIEVTGITQATLVNAPCLDVVMKKLVKHVNAQCAKAAVPSTTPRLLMTYNGDNFDLPILVGDLSRHAGDDAMLILQQLKLSFNIDMLPCARASLDETCLVRNVDGRASYKLGDVYMALLGHKLQNAHDALADSNAVLDVVCASRELCTVVCCDLSTDNVTQCLQINNPMTVLSEALAAFKKRLALSAGRTERGEQTIDGMIKAWKQQDQKKKKKKKCKKKKKNKKRQRQDEDLGIVVVDEEEKQKKIKIV
jgi:hypothetical protein